MKLLLTALIFALGSFTVPVPADTDFCGTANSLIEKFSKHESYFFIEDDDDYKIIPGFKKGSTLDYVGSNKHICNYIFSEGDDLQLAFDKLYAELKGCIKKKPKFTTFQGYGDVTIKEGIFKYKNVTISLYTNGKYLNLTFEKPDK